MAQHPFLTIVIRDVNSERVLYPVDTCTASGSDGNCDIFVVFRDTVVAQLNDTGYAVFADHDAVRRPVFRLYCYVGSQ